MKTTAIVAAAMLACGVAAQPIQEERRDLISGLTSALNALLNGGKTTTTTAKTSTTTSKSSSTSTAKTTSTTSSTKTSTTTSKSSSKTSTTASPTTTNGLSLGSVLSALEADFASDLAVVSSVAKVVASDVSKIAHGTSISFASQNPFKITSTKTHAATATHSLTWPTGATTSNGAYVNWTTADFNGVNMGCWLEVEYSCYEEWWASLGVPSTVISEWELCEALGSDCGTVLDKHYASFVNTSSIDKVAAVGVNLLRIPTTYAAWIDVPGSQFYHGDQQTYLKALATYAIETYGMHIVIGLHSLPGGVNSLDIGEEYGHDAWFQNSTNLAYSLQAVDQILDFITASGHPNSFTIEPINEASDNLAGFGSCAGLTSAGVTWVSSYINLVLAAVEKVNAKIPVLFQDCFCGESFWSPYFNTTSNLAIDTHVYYFADAGVYSEYVNPAVCGQAATLSGDGKFPVFVGEWSLQTTFNNTFANRASIFDTQRYAWSEYVHGGSMWNIVHYGNATVSGEGEQADYWSYIGLIDAGVITSKTNASYC